MTGQRFSNPSTKPIKINDGRPKGNFFLLGVPMGILEALGQKLRVYSLSSPNDYIFRRSEILKFFLFGRPKGKIPYFRARPGDSPLLIHTKKEPLRTFWGAAPRGMDFSSFVFYSKRGHASTPPLGEIPSLQLPNPHCSSQNIEILRRAT